MSRPVEDVVKRLAADGIDVVRVSYADLIGVERARDVLVERLPGAMEHGLSFCRAVYRTTPGGETVDVPGGLDGRRRVLRRRRLRAGRRRPLPRGAPRGAAAGRRAARRTGA